MNKYIKNESAFECSLSKVRSFRSFVSFFSSYAMVWYIKGVAAITVRNTKTMDACSLKTHKLMNKATVA